MRPAPEGGAPGAREPYAHVATVRLDGDGDDRAPGAAITVALCGHWDHEPPCPLAPHHTAVERDGGALRLRILFATEPANETEVRARIGAALAAGRVTGPDGRETFWTLADHAAAEVLPGEADHARRLVASGR